MTKLCIFDLDGTVLDTIHTIAYYGNFALSKHGIEPIPTDEYKYLVGTGMVNLIKKMLTFRGCYTDELFEKVIKAKDYPFSVITMLEKKLNEKGISNRCRDIYCKIHNCAISVL